MSTQLDLAITPAGSTVIAELPFTPNKKRKDQTTCPIEVACDAALKLAGFDPEEVVERRNGLSAVVLEAANFRPRLPSTPIGAPYFVRVSRRHGGAR